MKRKIALSIRNEQDFGQDNTDLLEYKTVAFLYKKNEQYYILYPDENYNGARTYIKIQPEEESIIIYRYEPELQQSFRSGRTTTGRLETPYGIFNLEIDTRSLEIDLDKGELVLRYRLYLEGKYICLNYLKISWDIL
ncbi:MAG: DUF1934 domain-containing protein [Halanaerobiaceae bacterium]|nr:DUF1934 domain-containing protein [Halanaerobiaceae bacterium]